MLVTVHNIILNSFITLSNVRTLAIVRKPYVLYTNKLIQKVMLTYKHKTSLIYGNNFLILRFVLMELSGYCIQLDSLNEAHASYKPVCLISLKSLSYGRQYT